MLGLDLQGGSHVLLEVDSNSVVKTLVMNLRDSVRRVLREEKVSITGGIGAQPRGVQLRIPDATERARVMPKLAIGGGFREPDGRRRRAPRRRESAMASFTSP